MFHTANLGSKVQPRWRRHHVNDYVAVSLVKTLHQTPLSIGVCMSLIARSFNLEFKLPATCRDSMYAPVLVICPGNKMVDTVRSRWQLINVLDSTFNNHIIKAKKNNSVFRTTVSKKLGKVGIQCFYYQALTFSRYPAGTPYFKI